MSSPRTYEATLLRPIQRLLKAAISDLPHSSKESARLQLLEALAAKLGGFELAWYQNNNPFGRGDTEFETEPHVDRLLKLVLELPYHPSLALATLAQPDLEVGRRRKEGVYYTDFRLAQALAAPLAGEGAQANRLLDPAAGTGILLVASVLALSKENDAIRDQILAKSIYAADLDPRALRGAALALSSLTSDHMTILSIWMHLRVGNSLVEGPSMWSDLVPYGFDAVIGNPPWEKLKLTRHEFLKDLGIDRHYGADYDESSTFEGLEDAKEDLDDHVSSIQEEYKLQGRGEPDLYKLFLELAIRLTSPTGRIAFLIPAGLIRSKGTQSLREHLYRVSEKLSLIVLDNRSKFFDIDTRFKFLAVHAERGKLPTDAIHLKYGIGTDVGVECSHPVRLPLQDLLPMRPDGTVPEIRTEADWRIWQLMYAHGTKLGDPTGPWNPSFMREVDMTRDRRNFKSEARRGDIPLIEGRMVHQYRHAAKRYIEGTGRRALWETTPFDGYCELKPQYWYPLDVLPSSTLARVEVSRVGFCDITGQTNERSMLAARIPAGIVCGNKVPTILFGGVPDRAREDLWLSLVNSFAFDWMLRRVITTSVNYFILQDLPLPNLDPKIGVGKRLSELAYQLGCHQSDALGMNSEVLWQQAEKRAEIEWLTLGAYGGSVSDLEIILEDFPLLDRCHSPLPGEPRSTITRDFVLLRAAEALGGVPQEQIAIWRKRVDLAQDLGAVPFVPSQLGSDAVNVALLA